MATYAIGDVQGCYSTLLKLLKHINFSPADSLWFCGDIINRGPESLATLRLVKELVIAKQAIMVLGNHELGALPVLFEVLPFNNAKHTFQDLMQAPDRIDLALWLCQLPLIYQDKALGYTLVHAGIPPQWSVDDAIHEANLVSTWLQDKTKLTEFLPQLYGDDTELPSPYQLFAHLRYIINALVRMRFCSETGVLELTSKPEATTATGSKPWFQHIQRKTKMEKLIFGHWSTLNGITNETNAIAIDTGAVWGGKLTAFRLEDGERFSVKLY